MAPEPDRIHVRLAELVSALSLGIDLGFGQPMEHVLRQCLIALRLAEGDLVTDRHLLTGRPRHRPEYRLRRRAARPVPVRRAALRD